MVIFMRNDMFPQILFYEKKVTYYHKFYFVVKNDMLPQILFYEKKYLFCYKIKFYG